MMKIGLLLPYFGPDSGGVGSVVRSFAEQIDHNTSNTVCVFDLLGGSKYPSSVNLLSSKGGLAGYSIEMVRRLKSSGIDILHQHGVWHPISAAVLHGHGSARIICSPHGMLEPWILSRGRLKKGVARLMYERALWSRVSCFHALTREEVNSIRDEVGDNVPVFYIPNGVAFASATIPNFDSKQKVILYFGRFHRKKGIQPLLRAWAMLGVKRMGYVLKLVGWGDVHEVDGADSIDGVEVCSPVFGNEAKNQLLSSARFVILPSFSEGMPMAILESWAQGTPAIMTKECNLPLGFANGAALEIDTSVLGIYKGLIRAIEMDSAEHKRMSDSSVLLAREFYSIDRTISSVLRMYMWALSDNVDVSDILV